MSIRLGIPSAVVLLCLAASAIAEDTKIATYDVRDLLTAIPDDRPDAAPATQPSRQAAIDDLTAAVRHVLPPDAAARFSDGRMLVTAGEDGQAAVKRLIEQAQADRALQIYVEARVIRIDDVALASLPDKLRTLAATAALNNGRRPAELDAALADAFFTAMHGPEGVSQLTAPRLMAFDGQQVCVTVASDVPYVKSLRTIRAADGKTGYEPEIDLLHPGVTMNVRSRTSADGAAAAMQLRLDLTELLSLDPDKQDGGVVQRPNTRTERFDGLYVVPRGKTLLIAPTSRTGTPAPDRHTFLLVKAVSIGQH